MGFHLKRTFCLTNGSSLSSIFVPPLFPKPPVAPTRSLRLPANKAHMNVLSLLRDRGVIKEGDIAAIEREAREQGSTIEEVLVRRGLSVEDVLRIKAEEYGIPARILPQKPVSQEALAYIPQESAEHYRFVPLGVESGALEVGVVDPDNMEALDALQFISTKVGMPYKLFLISESDFARVLEEYQNLTGEVGAALSELDTSIAETET